MDIEKFTDRAKASCRRPDHRHPRIPPAGDAGLHLAKALLDDSEGAASGLIRAAGGDPARVKHALEAGLAKLPKVRRRRGQPAIHPDIVRVLVPRSSRR